MKYISFFLLSLFLVTGCSKNAGTESTQNFKESPTFSVPVTFADGTKGEYILIGQKGKAAFQIGSGPKGKSEIMPIVEDKNNKYMWYLWGNDKELNGELKVKGIHESGHKETIFTASNVTAQEFNSADGSMPSMMEFSKAGKWKLDVYIGNEKIGTVIIDVEKAA